MEKRYDRLEEIVIGVKKNIDNIEEVQKFNPHHDSKGRFASGKGGAGGGMSHAERDAKEKYGMTMQQMRDAVANDPEANKIASEMLNTQMNAGINHMTFDEVAVLAYTQVHGNKGGAGGNVKRNKNGFISSNANGEAAPKDLGNGKAMYNAVDKIKWGDDGIGTLNLWTESGQTRLYIDGNMGSSVAGGKQSYTAYGDKYGGSGEFKVTYSGKNGKIDYTACEVMEM